MKVRNRKGGGRGGGWRIKRSRREKEMTVRAGRGWAKEASTEPDESSRPNTAEMMYFLFFTDLLEATARLNPQEYSPTVLDTMLTL